MQISMIMVNGQLYNDQRLSQLYADQISLLKIPK